MRDAGFTEVVFADDLNAFKAFDLATSNEEVQTAAKNCQKNLHSWGRANQVNFENTKESLHVFSHRFPQGEDFKLLGVHFDCKLAMETAVHKLAGEAHWKLRTLLRAAKYHCDADLVLLYKSRLLGYLEYRTPALYHASDTTLQALDKVQEKLLRVVGCTEREALQHWNLAPLSTRRDIALLGLVHRTVLGKGPKHFGRFFQRKAPAQPSFWTRAAERRHDKQLEEVVYPNCPELLRGSALGLVRVYNWLPADTVRATTVKEFQFNLQNLVRERARSNCKDWVRTFSPRLPWWNHPLR